MKILVLGGTGAMGVDLVKIYTHSEMSDVKMVNHRHFNEK